VDPSQLPRGQVTAIDIGRLNVWVGQDIGLPGYAVLASSSPGQKGLDRVIPPAPDSSRNVSYAIQWLIFAVIAVVGWGYLLRREHREALAAQAN
jgi:cytochrome oxidase assembly protein ShyY1